MRLSIQGILAAAAVAGAAASARASTSVALYPLQPLGIPAATADSLDRALRGEIGRLPGIRMLGLDRTVAAIKTGPESRGVACDGSRRCLAGLGRLLGVDEVVYGVASGVGRRFAFDLKLVDTATGREVRRVDARVGGGRESLQRGLREAALRLVAPEAGPRGVIIVKEDGRRPGPARDWAFRLVYGSLGVAALGLISGFLAQASRSAASSTARPLSPAEEPVLAGEIGRGIGFGAAADVFWGLAAAGLVGAGVLFALAGSDPHADHPIAVAPAGPGVALTARF